MASKYYKVYQGFQKLFNPSAKKKTDIPTTIIGVKPGKNLTTKRNIQDQVVKAVDQGVKKADVPQSVKDSQKTKQSASKTKREKSKELKDYSYRLDKLTEKKATGGRVGKMGGGMMGRRMGYSQGKLAVTPREKQLAAQYGDKKRITRGDVITAAKKKSGKRMQARNGTEDPKPKLMLNNIELVTTKKFNKKPKSSPKPKDVK